MSRVKPNKSIGVANVAQLGKRQVRIKTQTYREHEFVGTVLCVADEVGGRWASKIVLDCGIDKYVIGLTSITSIEILPEVAP